MSIWEAAHVYQMFVQPLILQSVEDLQKSSPRVVLTDGCVGNLRYTFKQFHFQLLFRLLFFLCDRTMSKLNRVDLISLVNLQYRQPVSHV